MASGGIAYVGCFLSFLAVTGIIFTTAFPEWKRNSVQSSQSNFIQVYSAEGLWLRCTSPQPGQYNCDMYDVAIIGLQAAIQGLRTMMCLAGILSLLGTITSIIGLPCNNTLNEKKKVLTLRIAGLMLLLAGTLCFASVTWYAVDVVRDFWLKNGLESTTFQYEFGAALYVGWVSSGVALIAGALMACCTCGGSDDSDDMGGYKYNYKPPAAGKPAARNTEYV
ncbi:claudin-4-like isoform X3 [Clavelina lepadiformis]|uniref:claudin-4-like isoform X3 n=1 Tax=Clavelina lepadiformis TaxID=159417 RepID=UPI0040415BBC